MTHAELRFSYKIPARCIREGVFATPDTAGVTFYFVEGERDSIESGCPIALIHIKAAWLSRYAINYLSSRRTTA